MNLLALVNQCGDPVLAKILGIMKSILSIIQLVGPIVGIISIIISLIKLVTNPEEKKYKKFIFNWLIAIFLLFLLPLIINLVMALLDDSFTISSCWNYAGY